VAAEVAARQAKREEEERLAKQAQADYIQKLKGV
jgi:hypothetical protein